MHIVLVSGGETGVRERMNGIGRLHWVKSRRSCLMKSKPYIYTNLILLVMVLECICILVHYFLL